MTGIQAKLLAILASLMTALPPAVCCLVVSQPCCGPSDVAATCCSQQLAESVVPSCCASKPAEQVAKQPLVPASDVPRPAQMCCCAKAPAIASVANSVSLPEPGVLLYVLPADWGTSHPTLFSAAPAWSMHPPSVARHVLLCVWRC